MENCGEQVETLDRMKTAGAYLSDDEIRQFDELRATLKNVVQKSMGGRIKYISYGGAAMPPRIMRFFELIGIPLIGSYGSTECGGVTLKLDRRNEARQPGSLSPIVSSVSRKTGSF